MIYRKHLLALALVAACSGERAATGDSAASSANQAGAERSGDAELADITAYRLTMDKIDRWMTAQRNVAMATAAMSPAERAAFEAESDDDDSNESMDDMVNRIEDNATMSKAVRDAGLSAREFTMITMSFVQSGMAAAVLKMRPNDNQDSLVREMKANMDNVRFIQENEAVLTQKRQAMEAELKAAGALPEESGSGDAEEY